MRILVKIIINFVLHTYDPLQKSKTIYGTKNTPKLPTTGNESSFEDIDRSYARSQYNYDHYIGIVIISYVAVSFE